jgi:prepilin-type N-terminal cleavage/methylation domain-containing protein
VRRGVAPAGREAAVRKSRGFTLLEMMIVVAIIAVLAFIAVPNFFGSTSQAEARAAVRKFRATVARARTLAATGKNENYAGWAATDRTVEAGILIEANGYRLFVDRNRITDGNEIDIEVVDFGDLARGSNYANTLTIGPAGEEIRFQKNGTLTVNANIDVTFRDTTTGLAQTVSIAYGGSTRVN